MSIARHPDFRLQRLTIGEERAPLLVIDNLLAEPDALVATAASKGFAEIGTYYPGVRAKVPLSFQQFVLELLREDFTNTFALTAATPRFTSCHFSLVTTPPERLNYLQRIPHTDSASNQELALIVYLFKSDLGGTSFYRHKPTGFEWVDESRKPEYLRHVERQQDEVMRTSTGFIAEGNAFYDRIGYQEGVFNRMLVYRRTSLHCGAPKGAGAISANPRAGRLTITGFIA